MHSLEEEAFGGRIRIRGFFLFFFFFFLILFWAAPELEDDSDDDDDEDNDEEEEEHEIENGCALRFLELMVCPLTYLTFNLSNSVAGRPFELGFLIRLSLDF